jgi:hypothetical protein
MLEKMLSPDCLRSHLGARTEVGSGTSQKPLLLLLWCGDLSLLSFKHQNILRSNESTGI